MCNSCNDRNHLDDSIDDLFGGSGEPVVQTPKLVEPVAMPTPPATTAEFADRALSNATFDPKGPASFEEDCPKCKGRGRFISYTGRDVGPCFHCEGKGKVLRKTSKETREKAAAAKAARHEAKVAEWHAAHAEESAWMIAASIRGFNFALDMLQAVKKYGDLKDYKLAKVREFMAKDAEREQQKTAIAAAAPTLEATALNKIEQAFATAMANQIKAPKLRLGTFLFSKVTTGQNAGGIYVKSIDRDDAGERRYLGKIVEGKFHRAFKTTGEEEQQIIDAALDPAAAAKAYGQRTGTCSICGRELTRAESIDRAMGPICADRYGW